MGAAVGISLHLLRRNLVADRSRAIFKLSNQVHGCYALTNRGISISTSRDASETTGRSCTRTITHPIRGST